VSEQAPRLLNEGLEVPEVGRRVGILANTLHKALRTDKEAPLGYGTTRTLERVAAAIGMLDGTAFEFERVPRTYPMGGSSLLLSGINKIYTMPEGFYPIETIFLLLALMALARIPSAFGTDQAV
jgi:hypothetical protein